MYPNGIKIPISSIKFLNDLPDDPHYDREYINKFYTIVFSEKYLMKKLRSGKNRTEMLQILRGTKRYATMKGIYLSSVACFHLFFFHINIFITPRIFVIISHHSFI